ncbi:sporulation protein [Haloglomus litoreum]|uniref:sporulation protein n=1 Tax=Haloglomus litoreum TaxID=3034026 RepID=UPI0023E85280|nr:sporulation protein [Haloglomus sp. DT116]
MGLLSRLGIGAATVEPALHAPRVVAGDTAPVRVTVRGGSSGQHADELTVRLVTEATTGGGGTELVTVAETVLATDLRVDPETEREFAGALDVPVWAPITGVGAEGGTEVVLAATLAMDWSREPTGRTGVQVDPAPRLDRALAALAALGIQVERARPVISSVGGSEAPTAPDDPPVVQQFDCHPHAGPYVGRISDLTVVAVPEPGALVLHLDTDVATETAYGTTDAYECFTTVEVTDESVPTLRRQFERALGTGTTSDPSPGV